MALDLTSATEWPDEQLQALVIAANSEMDRRKTIAAAAAEVVKAASGYLGATGQKRDGSTEWVQPTGAHDAYPKGWRVKSGGKVWESLIDGNTAKPGTSGWRQVTDGSAPAPWVQPAGAHDAYHAGESVAHRGTVWKSRIDGNVWEPPIQWEETPVNTMPPSPTAPVTPPVTPVVAAWSGSSVVYKVGDQVTYNGATYTCQQAHTSQAGWTPTAYPAGWKKAS